MRIYWIVVFALLTSCAQPPKTPSIAPLPTVIVRQSQITPQREKTATPTPSIMATHTLVPIPPKAKQIEVLVLPVVTADAQWEALAQELSGKAQQALDGEHWEDIKFKEDAYATINKMIYTSQGKLKEESRNILKHFRWGMEFMDNGSLQNLIDILAQYN
jgi:hypothetical protein